MEGQGALEGKNLRGQTHEPKCRFSQILHCFPQQGIWKAKIFAESCRFPQKPTAIRRNLGKPNVGITEGGLPVTVQGPPFWSDFCSIMFRPLLVLHAILVGIGKWVPAIASYCEYLLTSWTIAKSPLGEPPPHNVQRAPNPQPKLHSPVWVGLMGGRPQRGGTNLGVFVPAM